MEEISLRELIEILLKRKIFIIAITAIAVLAAGIISFFVLNPIYEAKVVLMASNISALNKEQEGTHNIKELLDSISQYPQMSIEAYKEQIKNPNIMEQTIKELNLDEKDINRLTLRNMITLNTVKDTNLITISVKNKDKVLAENIANTVANKFTVHVSEIAKTQADKSSNYIKTQLEIEKAKLDEALVEYKHYLAQPQGLTELEKEVSTKIDLVNTYKTKLLDIEINEKKIVASLNAAEKELDKTSEKLLLKKSIVDDSLLASYAEDETGKKLKDLANINLEAEEINQNYINLKSQMNNFEIYLSDLMAEKEATIKSLEKTRNELETLQVDLADKKHQDKTIMQKVDFAQSTYEAFLKKYEEIRILKSSDIGDASIIIVSPAVEPIKPIAPNKKLNVAIAGVLGLMLGVLGAFFMEYWTESGKIKVEIREAQGH